MLIDETHKCEASAPPSAIAKALEVHIRQPAKELLELVCARRRDLAYRQRMIQKVTDNVHLLSAYSVEGIALITGISRGQVSTIRNRASIRDKKEELGKFTWMEDAVDIIVGLLKGESVSHIAKRLNKDRRNIHTIKVNAIAAGFDFTTENEITTQPRGKNNLMKALYLLYKGRDTQHVAKTLNVCKLGVQVLERIAIFKKLILPREQAEIGVGRKNPRKG